MACILQRRDTRERGEDDVYWAPKPTCSSESPHGAGCKEAGRVVRRRNTSIGEAESLVGWRAGGRWTSGGGWARRWWKLQVHEVLLVHKRLPPTFVVHPSAGKRYGWAGRWGLAWIDMRAVQCPTSSLPFAALFLGYFDYIIFFVDLG
ncbi:hypothetical protein DFP72DRAFT_843279 [Ephemerocybe angulata]|uniref:Uncharacterized protein n=1 Tax=Ephemerocybe angulata TaxID=980116 RepID=A0A8H6I9H9_9AGAR|nr:hypothetical protein DFP72DRAFT_843279 [Tulosesus angulatus]